MTQDRDRVRLRCVFDDDAADIPIRGVLCEPVSRDFSGAEAQGFV